MQVILYLYDFRYICECVCEYMLRNLFFNKIELALFSKKHYHKMNEAK